MPSKAPTIPLHFGSCMDDLNRESEPKLDGRPPKLIRKGLGKLYEKGMEYRSAGDDEMAYIFFMRWINCIRWLQKSPEVSNNKDFLKPYVSGKMVIYLASDIAGVLKFLKIFLIGLCFLLHASQVTDTLDILEELHTVLKERYAAKRLEESIKLMVNNVEKMEIESDHTNNDDLLDEMGDVQLNLPDTPTDDPGNKEPETTITCVSMFQEIKKLNGRAIVIDIRSRDDFQQSHIINDRCINLPADFIKPG